MTSHFTYNLALRTSIRLKEMDKGPLKAIIGATVGFFLSGEWTEDEVNVHELDEEDTRDALKEILEHGMKFLPEEQLKQINDDPQLDKIKEILRDVTPPEGHLSYTEAIEGEQWKGIAFMLAGCWIEWQLLGPVRDCIDTCDYCDSLQYTPTNNDWDILEEAVTTKYKLPTDLTPRNVRKYIDNTLDCITSAIEDITKGSVAQISKTLKLCPIPPKKLEQAIADRGSYNSAPIQVKLNLAMAIWINHSHFLPLLNLLPHEDKDDVFTQDF